MRRSRLPGGRRAIFSGLVAGLVLGVAWAQPGAAPLPTRLEGDVRYVRAESVARALGDIVTEGEGSLTWRTGAGVLTVFDGSPDATLHPAGGSARELALSAPARRLDDGWYLPLDAYEAIGLRFEGEALRAPDGRAWALAPPPPPAVAPTGGASEVVDLGHGVVALRFYAPAGPLPDDGSADAPGAPGAAAHGAGDDPAISLLVADLDLLPLVVPDARAAVDGALDGVGEDKPLLLLVTATAPGPWQATLRFAQGERQLEVRYPYRMRLLFGDAARVAPGAPAAALVLLPPWFTLYRPIEVVWQGLQAEVTFRR